MASILQNILNIHHQSLEQWGDPRLHDWFLMGSIWPILTIIGCYLYFVLHLGPKFMVNRKPFNLDKILILYNAVQVISCFTLFFMTTVYIIPYYSVFCEPCDFSMSFRGILAAKLFWWYFILKIVDLLDTIFFVLRKSYRQVTFLHVYHHVSMVAIVWVALKLLPGGSSVYSGYLNCIVHVVMHSYYLLTVVDKTYRDNMFLKKQVTHVQFVQFGIMLLIYTPMLVRIDCDFPKWIPLIAVIQNVLMFYMFGNFYMKTYILPKKNNNPATK